MTPQRIRRRLTASLVAAITALTVFAAAQSPAVAEAPAATGRWWRARSGPLGEAALRPQQVPEGGLYVSGAPDGPMAISALRYEVAPDAAGSATLTLEVAEEQGGDDAKLIACPATAPWEATDGGAWDQKPEAACEQATVDGERSPDGKQWTFDLASLASEGPLDIVLTPGTVEGLPDGANGSTFEISFQPPSPDALTTASSSGESPSVEEGSTTRGGGEVTGSDSAAAGAPGGASAYEAPGPTGADQPQAQPEGGEQQQAAAPPKVQDQGRAATSTADTRRNLVLSGSVLFAILGAVVLTAAAQRQFPTVRRPSRTESAA